MIFQYLGTSASEAVPAVFCECEMCGEARLRGGRDLRTRSCAVIDEKLMLDFGPEVYAQSARFNVHLSRVKYLFVTHPHTDHFQMNNFNLRGGFWGMNLAEDVLTVYGGKDVYAPMRDFLDNRVRAVVKPHLDAKEIHAFETVELPEYTVTALRACHDPSIECLFYRIKSKADGKTVLYIHDTENDIADSLSFIADEHVDMVSFDCTMGNKYVPKGERHMGFRNNIEVRDALLKNGCIDSSTRLICNHICHHVGLYDDLARLLATEGFELSYDGMRVLL